jgi:uncharacterized protein (DUF433 family)
MAGSRPIPRSPKATVTRSPVIVILRRLTLWLSHGLLTIERGIGSTRHEGTRDTGAQCGRKGYMAPFQTGFYGGLSMTIKWQDYIEERKEVMMGKPVFKGTRLTVEHVLNELGTGMNHEELLENYPPLKLEHIQAAMLYAAAVVAMDESIYQ